MNYSGIYSFSGPRWESAPSGSRCGLDGDKPDGGEVLQGFAHLQALDGEVPRVDEVVDPLPAGSVGSADMVVPLSVVAAVQVGLCLGELVGMVGEAQVLPAGVDVDSSSQHLIRHR